MARRCESEKRCVPKMKGEDVTRGRLAGLEEALQEPDVAPDALVPVDGPPVGQDGHGAAVGPCVPSRWSVRSRERRERDREKKGPTDKSLSA